MLVIDRLVLWQTAQDLAVNDAEQLTSTNTLLSPIKEIDKSAMLKWFKYDSNMGNKVRFLYGLGHAILMTQTHAALKKHPQIGAMRQRLVYYRIV